MTNYATFYQLGDTVPRPATASEAFAGVWERAQLHRHRGGTYVAAVSGATGQTTGIRLPRSDDTTPQWIVVGRHTHCDLHLLDDPRVALRQTLVRIRQHRTEPRVRILDLCTQAGMLDGLGRPCGSVEAQRHATVSFAGAHLFVLDLDALADVTTEAEAWAQLEADQAAATLVRVDDPETRDPYRVGPTATFERTASWVGEHVPFAGELCGALRLPNGHASFGVYASMLQRGLLVGRYERCGIDRFGGPYVDGLSRVHLCLVRDGGEVWAVDTASTNGVKVDGEPVHAVRLGTAATLELANRLTMVWDAHRLH